LVVAELERLWQEPLKVLMVVILFFLRSLLLVAVVEVVIQVQELQLGKMEVLAAVVEAEILEKVLLQEVLEIHQIQAHLKATMAVQVAIQIPDTEGEVVLVLLEPAEPHLEMAVLAHLLLLPERL
jgi:hypothetical protein